MWVFNIEGAINGQVSVQYWKIIDCLQGPLPFFVILKMFNMLIFQFYISGMYLGVL